MSNIIDIILTVATATGIRAWIDCSTFISLIIATAIIFFFKVAGMLNPFLRIMGSIVTTTLSILGVYHGLGWPLWCAILIFTWWPILVTIIAICISTKTKE